MSILAAYAAETIVVYAGVFFVRISQLNVTESLQNQSHSI